MIDVTAWIDRDEITVVMPDPDADGIVVRFRAGGDNRTELHVDRGGAEYLKAQIEAALADLAERVSTGPWSV